MASNLDTPKVRRFFIDISPTSQNDLKSRLKHSRFPDQLAGAGWDYGSELTFMKVPRTYLESVAEFMVTEIRLDHLQGLVDYWEHSFNWPKQQEWLNSHFSHYKMMYGSY